MSPAPGAERLRVVLDTNIYVGAFAYPTGGNAVIWSAALEWRFRLLVSPAILEEMARVLRAKFAWRDDRVRRIVRVVALVARVITPRTTLKVVVTDPDDHRILECAVDGAAQIIVSNDHHLLELEAYEEIPIITGRDFRRTHGLR